MLCGDASSHHSITLVDGLKWHCAVAWLGFGFGYGYVVWCDFSEGFGVEV